MADNPLVSSADVNERRIVAYGLRNPFRFTVRPGTNELWVGDVGWGAWEEIDRVDNPRATPVKNFGWPCYEGPNRQSGWDALDVNLCESLYAQAGGLTAPFYAYHHAAQVVPSETCPAGSSSITGISFAFYAAGRTRRPTTARCSSPTAPAGASGRCCATASTLPDKTRIQTFVAAAANPVDLQVGPGGDLFYADFDGGTVKRIRYTAGNQAPTAVATASPSSGHRAADRALRRHAVHRPRPRRHAHLRLGPRRRRRLRRLDVRAADLDVHAAGHVHRQADRRRQPRGARAPTP